MKSICLKRVAYTDDGVFGVLIDGNIPFALTLEETWKDNQKEISCIPTGVYICQRVTSPKFGGTFQVMDVPNRDHILFHKGNTTEETLGCILVGEQFEPVDVRYGIWHSGKGFKEFMDRLNGHNEFQFTVLAV
jgi:hypothetical protein